MTTFVLGINHNTASVSTREKVAFAPELMTEALQQACSRTSLTEIAILSTCNRTEIYCATEAESADTCADEVRQWLQDYHALQTEELDSCLYHYNGTEAVRHMMKVASGLDSMVLGEPQILGQIKSACAVAREADTLGSELNRAFEDTFSIAKKVRTDTAIGENPISVAFAAVSLAQHIFSDLSEARALLIGAGRTIELVVQHLREAGIAEIVVANRTLKNALELKKKYGVNEVLLSDIPEQLAFSDIVVSSTASQLPILGKGAVERAMKTRKHRPIFMVDLAVPRDIEEEVGELDDIFLYSVDDLRQVIDSNVKNREHAAREAEQIIDAGIASFEQRLRSRNAVSTLRQFRAQGEALRDQELEKALQSLSKGEDPGKVLADFGRLLTNKLLHSPTVQMKKASAEGRNDLVQLARELYELGEDDPAAK